MSGMVEFRVNQEHRGVGLAVTFLLVVALFIGYRLAYRLLPLIFGGARADYILVSGFAALVFAVAILWFSDPLIKYLLPSGSVIKLDPAGDQLLLSNRSEDETDFDFGGSVDQLFWSFRMRKFPKSGRERQIPGHWHCCACRIIQADQEIILFSFVHPRIYKKIEKVVLFKELDLGELKEDGAPRFEIGPKAPKVGPLVPAKLIVGENGQYWLSERNRQRSGLELTPRDYQKVLTFLASHLEK